MLQELETVLVYALEELVAPKEDNRTDSLSGSISDLLVHDFSLNTKR